MGELVFAYGSNMCSGGLARAATTYPEADIVHAPGFRGVWGVLYSVSATDPKELCRKEVGYRRQRTRVTPRNGHAIACWVLSSKPSERDASLRPYARYKRLLVEGAREHKLPPRYLAGLSAIECIDDPDRAHNRRRMRLICGQLG